MEKRQERERKQHLARWKGKIQNELVDLSTGADAVPDYHTYYHYRSHQIHLDSGTCYIWFSLHVRPPTDTEVVVMLDASSQTVMSHNKKTKKGDGEETEIEVIEFVNLYPLRPPRIQMISGCEHLPRGSNIADGDMMDWNWFREDVSTKWSPVLGIHDAVESLAVSLCEDYCRLSRPLPPKEIVPHGLCGKVMFFFFGCFYCFEQSTDKKKPSPSLNRLQVVEGQNQNGNVSSRGSVKPKTINI